MITRNLLLLAAFLLLFTGCPAGPATEGGGTSDAEIGQVTKDLVDSFLAKAEKAPARAKGDLSMLLESLEGSAQRSEAFAKVRDEAKKLQDLYQSNADKSELTGQMTSLRAASDELPKSAN